MTPRLQLTGRGGFDVAAYYRITWQLLVLLVASVVVAIHQVRRPRRLWAVIVAGGVLTAATTVIPAALADHPTWAVVDGKLHRELRFTGFAQAFGFMTQVALAAEKLDHHPDWSNSWNRVVIDITNHDAGGLTPRCFQLAAAIDTAAASAG